MPSRSTFNPSQTRSFPGSSSGNRSPSTTNTTPTGTTYGSPSSSYSPTPPQSSIPTPGSNGYGYGGVGSNAPPSNYYYPRQQTEAPPAPPAPPRMTTQVPPVLSSGLGGLGTGIASDLLSRLIPRVPFSDGSYPWTPGLPNIRPGSPEDLQNPWNPRNPNGNNYNPGLPPLPGANQANKPQNRLEEKADAKAIPGSTPGTLYYIDVQYSYKTISDGAVYNDRTTVVGYGAVGGAGTTVSGGRSIGYVDAKDSQGNPKRYEAVSTDAQNSPLQSMSITGIRVIPGYPADPVIPAQQIPVPADYVGRLPGGNPILDPQPVNPIEPRPPINEQTLAPQDRTRRGELPQIGDQIQEEATPDGFPFIPPIPSFPIPSLPLPIPTPRPDLQNDNTKPAPNVRSGRGTKTTYSPSESSQFSDRPNREPETQNKPQPNNPFPPQIPINPFNPQPPRMPTPDRCKDPCMQGLQDTLDGNQGGLFDGLAQLLAALLSQNNQQQDCAKASDLDELYNDLLAYHNPEYVKLLAAINSLKTSGALDDVTKKTVIAIWKILGGDNWGSVDDDPAYTTDLKLGVEFGFTTVYGQQGNTRPTFENLPRLLNGLMGVMYGKAGYQRLPATLPKSLHVENGNEEKLAETVVIDNATDLSMWQFDQMDAAIGSYPIEIKYKKPDGSTELLKIKNSAEMQAEQLGVLLTLGSESDTQTALALKTIAEVVKGSVLGVKNNYLIQSLIEWNGYRTSTMNEKVPCAITPGGEDLETTLKEGELNVEVIKFDEKEDLADHLNKLLLYTGIVKNVFWRTQQNELPGGRMKTTQNNESGAADVNWDAFINSLKNPNANLKNPGQPPVNIKDYSIGKPQPGES